MITAVLLHQVDEAKQLILWWEEPAGGSAVARQDVKEVVDLVLVENGDLCGALGALHRPVRLSRVLAVLRFLSPPPLPPL